MLGQPICNCHQPTPLDFLPLRSSPSKTQASSRPRGHRSFSPVEMPTSVEELCCSSARSKRYSRRHPPKGPPKRAQKKRKRGYFPARLHVVTNKETAVVSKRHHSIGACRTHYHGHPHSRPNLSTCLPSCQTDSPHLHAQLSSDTLIIPPRQPKRNIGTSPTNIDHSRE